MKLGQLLWGDPEETKKLLLENKNKDILRKLSKKDRHLMNNWPKILKKKEKANVQDY